MHREVANAIIAGARNARGGERACPAEGSEGVIHCSSLSGLWSDFETASPQVDVFCGTAPRADEFLRRLASIVVTRRTGYSEGPNFPPNYAILLHKWRTRLSLTINREIANAIFEGS